MRRFSDLVMKKSKSEDGGKGREEKERWAEMMLEGQEVRVKGVWKAACLPARRPVHFEGLMFEAVVGIIKYLVCWVIGDVFYVNFFD